MSSQLLIVKLLDSTTITNIMGTKKENDLVLDEDVEVLHFPDFDAHIILQEEEAKCITLGIHVESQVHTYVLTIASLYHDNPFHNFEHTSHIFKEKRVCGCFGKLVVLLEPLEFLTDI